MSKVILSLCCLFLLASCASMRDYVGERNGHVGPQLIQGFGEGGDLKDYFVTKEGVDIIKRDTKNEISLKIGDPTSIERMLDGNEAWIYEKRGFKLFFDDNYLLNWESL